MDPLMKRRLGTLVVFGLALGWAIVAISRPEAGPIFAFVSGFTFCVGLYRYLDDRTVARQREEVLERFLRPRFDKDTFGGWRSHGGEPGAGEAE